MVGPMLLQPGIGRILDQKWSGQLSGSVRVYGVEAFQTGFLLIVAWSLVSCVLISFTRETHCKASV